MPHDAFPDARPPRAPGPIPNPPIDRRRARAPLALAALLLTVTLSAGCSTAPLLCDDPDEARTEQASHGRNSIGALFGVISGFFTTDPDH